MWNHCLCIYIQHDTYHNYLNPSITCVLQLNKQKLQYLCVSRHQSQGSNQGGRSKHSGNIWSAGNLQICTGECSMIFSLSADHHSNLTRPLSHEHIILEGSSLYELVVYRCFKDGVFWQYIWWWWWFGVHPQLAELGFCRMFTTNNMVNTHLKMWTTGSK